MRFLASMRALMRYQPAGGGTSEVTVLEVTGVWSLACVRALVRYQATRP